MAQRLHRSIAVTGAEGFIARRFLELFATDFERVVGLVRTFPVNPVDGVEYRAADVSLAHAVRFAIRDCDAVVHLAYDHRNRAHAADAAEHVAAACRTQGVARLVQVSTVAVYDQTIEGVLDEDTPAARWRDPYIESKLRIERRLAEHWRDGYRASLILQPTIVYGWGGAWTDHALRGCRAGSVELPAAGAGVCNAVYVDDVCAAIDCALEAPPNERLDAPPRYLVTGPAETTWKAFFEAHGAALEGVPVDRGGAPAIVATPTERRFHDDPKKDAAMALAFRPAAAGLLYSLLRLRPAKQSGGGGEALATLRSPPSAAPLRFDGMGRLYLAVRCVVDGSRAAEELGYRPQYDLQRGVERVGTALRTLTAGLQTMPAPGLSIDLAGESPPTPLRRRVAVIGTGLGGGALAAELLRRGEDVVIVEAGNGGALTNKPDNVELDNVGMDFGLAIYRDISVGGSGNAWRGLCSPRDPIDYEERDWVPLSGAPVGLADLTSAGRAAAALLRIDDYDLFTDQSTLDEVAERIDDMRFERHEFGLKYFLQTRPPRSFRADLLRACDHGGGPLLLQNAPALELVTDASGRRVERCLVKDGAGRTHAVEADTFVVCAGALETPRLLLNSRHAGAPEGGPDADGVRLGNERGLVGRYLMDHPMASLGQVRLRRPRTAALYHALQLSQRRMIKAGIVMQEEAQRRHRLPNHSVFLLPSLHRGFDDRYERARRALITARRRRLSAADVLTVATNPNVIQWALSYVSSLSALFRYADLFFIAEQTPTADSRVTLADRRDRYGYPVARAHWTVSDDDIDSMLRFNELLLTAFPQSDYEVTHRRPREEVRPALTSAAHFCGTARMGSSPRTSVVDADLKVWGLDNLYVCDGSVLPTSGNANPGLGIVTLAVRLAEQLTRSG